MTWSILARDGRGRFGVAIASRFFAVGALVPAQPPRRRRAVDAGADESAVRSGRARPARRRPRRRRRRRRADSRPTPAATSASCICCPPPVRRPRYTGAACIDWCGHLLGDDFSVAGNMLAGPQVLDRDRRRPIATAPVGRFAERLLAAMAAGEAAGGDKRGKQAAALRIHGDEDYPRARPARRRPRRSAAPNCSGCTQVASSASSRSSPACRAAHDPGRASPTAREIEARDRALPRRTRRARRRHGERAARGPRPAHRLPHRRRRIRRGRRRQLRGRRRPHARRSSANRAAARA